MPLLNTSPAIPHYQSMKYNKRDSLLTKQVQNNKDVIGWSSKTLLVSSKNLEKYKSTK